MRILLASDLHYTLPQLDWIEHVAPEHDVVVLAGDHLDVASSVRPEVQAAAVLAHFRRLAGLTRLVVCSGNHDLTGRDGNGEKAPLWLAEAGASGVAVDGDSVELGDVLLTVCPWWDGPQGQEAVGPAARPGRRASPGRLDLGVPLAADRVAHDVDRPSVLRRCRAVGVDRRAPA